MPFLCCLLRQAREFLKLILVPDSCLHCLLPAPRDKDLIARLRFPRKFPASLIKRFQSPLTRKFRSLALSVIFILSLHIVHYLLCSFIFLCAHVYLSY